MNYQFNDIVFNLKLQTFFILFLLKMLGNWKIMIYKKIKY